MKTTDAYMNRLLEQIVELLDIPPSYYQKAADRYRSLGEWLCRDESQVAKLNPQVCPHGSFRYGTVIRPLLKSEEYDLDLVCEVVLSKLAVSQQQLKNLVGDELKAYAEAHRFHGPAEEKNRCWRLNYADEVSFHMDILPVIPEDQAFIALLQQLGVPYDLAKTAVAITDKRHPKYAVIDPDWLRSNPRGFAKWFEGRTREVAHARAMQLVMERRYASVDEVPPYEWKTPLQRSIQLFKRHRDVMFKDNPNLRPISMIITTLAAHAYEGETNLYDAFSHIVDRMPEFVRPSKPRIPNPVNPFEDFADRWALDARLEKNFWVWHAQVKADIESLRRLMGSEQLLDVIRKRFGVDLTGDQVKELAALSLAISSQAARTTPVIQIRSAPKPWRGNG
jgi:hypothetical protein